jgi:hypothetical protein
MSNLKGQKVLVYTAPGLPPYEAIVKATEIAQDGVELVTQVIPLKDPTKVLNVADKVVTFVASPLGKQIYDWFAKFFSKFKRKHKK